MVNIHRKSVSIYLVSLAVSLFLLLLLLGDTARALERTEQDYELKLLGKYIFFDNISTPQRMACASCHDPETGGTGTTSGINQHQVTVTGANPHTHGNLKPPTNIYASLIPPFQECELGGFRLNGIQYCGGNFWDGRAEGRPDPLFPAGATPHIGEEVFQGLDPQALVKATGYADYFGPTSDQALNPMPNPVEQNIDRQSVCEHVATAPYVELYRLAWGVELDCSDTLVVAPDRAYDITFKRLMLAVGAWQHSADLNSFSSKRDNALRAEIACVEGAVDADPAVCDHPNYVNSPGTFPLVGLTDQENLGHDLFYNAVDNVRFPDLPVANCSFCHSDNPPLDDGSEPHQLYADSAYHNIGVPANPELPAAPAPGIGGHVGGDPGFFKTPILRNVDKRKGKGFTKAYGHNGWFKSLESIVHFYNTAAIDGATAQSFGITRCPPEIATEREALADNCWPAPEHPGAAIPFLVGDLGMSSEQEAALVAYMKTFTDLATPRAPQPYQGRGVRK